MVNVVDILNLSAPGADSLAKPTALSNKSEFAFDALTISSFIDKPILYEGIFVYWSKTTVDVGTFTK